MTRSEVLTLGWFTVAAIGLIAARPLFTSMEAVEPAWFTAPGSAFRIDLNSADESILQLLPSIGAIKARAIVDWRRAHGPFRRVEDLDAVPGLGSGRIRRLAPWATCRAQGS